MYMIEVTEDKVSKLSDHIEKGLHHLGRAMSCVEQMMGSEYGDRGGMYYRDEGKYGRYSKHIGMRDDYGYRGSMGYKDDEDEWEMNERRRRDSRGRYI